MGTIGIASSLICSNRRGKLLANLDMKFALGVVSMHLNPINLGVIETNRVTRMYNTLSGQQDGFLNVNSSLFNSGKCKSAKVLSTGWISGGTHVTALKTRLSTSFSMSREYSSIFRVVRLLITLESNVWLITQFVGKFNVGLGDSSLVMSNVLKSTFYAFIRSGNLF